MLCSPGVDVYFGAVKTVFGMACDKVDIVVMSFSSTLTSAGGCHDFDISIELSSCSIELSGFSLAKRSTE